ncbi:hypothetical protein EUGRSUZ_B01930, partial [Eucalyptus grandis]
MACSCLRVKSIWAEDLKDANFFRIHRSMNPYVIVSISDGVKQHEEKQHSPVHKDGGTDPRWDHPFSLTVDEAAARAGRLKLKFEIKAEKTFRSDRKVGSVEVPVKKLLDQPGGDGEWKMATYGVWLPSGEKTKGVLNFSYQFGDLEAAVAPPTDGAVPHFASEVYPPQGYAPHPKGHGPKPRGHVNPAWISAGLNAWDT